MAFYLKFRFAFPDAANPLIDSAGELERRALERALAGKPAYAFHHPYPVSIPVGLTALGPNHMVEPKQPRKQGP